MIKWKESLLSEICLGTAQFGMNYGISNKSGQIKDLDAHQIIDWVIKSGVNCFDTAQAYGRSELVIGSYLLSDFYKNLNREVNIISKTSSRLFEHNFENQRKVLKQSLDRLSQEYIFAILLHDLKSYKKWGSKEVNSIRNLVDNHLIRHFGVSIYSTEEFEFAIDHDEIEIIQIPFNVFDQRAKQGHWIEKALDKNKLIFIRSIYLQGLLLFKPQDIPCKFQHISNRIKKLDTLSKEFSMTRSQLLFNYVISVSQGRAILLFGCDNITQAQETIKNYRFSNHNLFSPQDVEKIGSHFLDLNESVYNPTKW